MLGNFAYIDDVFEDDVSPVMVMEIHLVQETTDYGVDFEPTRVTDGVVPHDEYRDEMDMSMSQIGEMVQPEPTSSFDLFGVSAIEIAEEI